MRRLRRIKILATLGPASSDATIRRLFEAGADVFRINTSHTSHEKMRELVKTIRGVEFSYGRPIGILVDFKARNFAWARSPKARSSSTTAKISFSIPTRHLETAPASSFASLETSQPSNRVMCSCSTTARCA